MSSKRLGKGLGALLSDTNTSIDDIENIKKDTNEIKINSIKPNSFQPRKVFDSEKLEELKDSIKEHGIIQPIVVRKKGRGYELVVGERRLRASKELGLATIPAIIKCIDDDKMLEIALIENIQRHDLNAVEEAKAYKTLIEKYGFNQEELAKSVGKSRPYIANFLRLLNLPESILELLRTNKITVGHARSLLSLDDEAIQARIAQDIISQELSVRETESLIKTTIKPELKEKVKPQKQASSPLILDLQDKLRSKFGTKVSIKENKDNGKIEIEFYSKDDLQRILDLILQEEI